MRNGMWLGMVIVALVVFSPDCARADQPAHGAGGPIEKLDKELKKSEDQIDLFKGWIDLSIYTIVVFLILFTILRKFAWPQIAEGLDRRERTIARDKAEAEKVKREADEMRARYQADMARANDEIRQMIDKAKQDAEKTAAEELARGKAELQAERDRLHRELSVARDQALHQVWNQAAQLATLISSKAIGKQLSYDDHRALLDESLAEFRQALQARREDIESARA